MDSSGTDAVRIVTKTALLIISSWMSADRKLRLWIDGLKALSQSKKPRRKLYWIKPRNSRRLVRLIESVRRSPERFDAACLSVSKFHASHSRLVSSPYLLHSFSLSEW